VPHRGLDQETGGPSRTWRSAPSRSGSGNRRPVKNLAIRGIEGQIAHGDTFHSDRFPDLKAEFILANP
jgi:hypothetical protein